MNKLKVLKVGYNSGNTWGYDIWNVINDLERVNPDLKMDEKNRKSLGDIMLAISYRIDFLPMIESRINENLNEIYRIVYNRDKEKDEHSLAIPVDIKHFLLIDIDSFVFEMRSCCELIEKLTKKIFRFYKKHKLKNLKFPIQFQEWEKNDWYRKLKNTRIVFFHHIAPNIGIDITNKSRYDIIFGKENIHDYNSCNNYIRLSEISGIYSGFWKGIRFMQDESIKGLKHIHENN